MKKIVHIIDTLCVGGRENSVIDICNHLDKKKYKVFIITLTNDLNELSYKINSDVTLYSLPIKHHELVGVNAVFFFFKAIKNLSNVLDSICPNIVHTHSYLHRLLIENLAIKRIKNDFKSFHTVHTSGMYYKSDKYFDKLKFLFEKFTIGLVNPFLVGISEVVQSNNIQLYRYQSKTSRYIPNGVDLEIYHKEIYDAKKTDFGCNENDIIITYVARFCDGKNHETLLKAIKIVVNKYPSAKLILAGDGERRGFIEDFLDKNKLQQNVILLGAIKNVAELLSVSSFCVFPSEFEGFSLTLIEKMAMGLPVVAADNDSFKSLIIHKENGLLFSMFDEVALADNIFELIENKEFYEKIATNSLSFSKQFSLNKIVALYEDYYQN
ncbi:glycosyltransferase family 4 protein [Flavobacterium tistrianum]|uniref:glycosyltransferase family 4 protein n=1 Tax=Flavobacterium tistrianum TaxID=1685414 RepID=UPI000DAB5E70|nr:glycosyltransferase family 4 protein [Flavobacterium tistrianum]KAF2342043.1 glycosyltransferase family 4 protein [Flavobacterium tistrianum]